MIYSFFGTDREKIVARGRDIVASAHKKRPDAEVVRIDAGNFSPTTVQDLVSRQGLFERKIIAVLDGFLSDTKTAEDISKALPEFKKSENLFVILEGVLLKAEREALKKYSEKCDEISLVKKELKEQNGFAISDALCVRDAKKAWSAYMAVSKTTEPEMLAGTLAWQVRGMLLASEPGMTEAKSKLSPFVFKKSAAGAKKYTREELKELLFNITIAYHKGHAGEDLGEGIEKILLGI